MGFLDIFRRTSNRKRSKVTETQVEEFLNEINENSKFKAEGKPRSMNKSNPTRKQILELVEAFYNTSFEQPSALLKLDYKGDTGVVVAEIDIKSTSFPRGGRGLNKGEGILEIDVRIPNMDFEKYEYLLEKYLGN